MKRVLFLISFTAATVAGATIGDTVANDSSIQYVADGVSVSNFGTGYLQTDRINSSRFYDSTKGNQWVTSSKSDSLMCWSHAASNVIQYWQSYYGVFAKPQQGIYFNESGTQIGQVHTSSLYTMPLPYGKIGTENAAYGDTTQVPDSRSLTVARDMYYNIDSNMGGSFKAAAEWFFRGQTDLSNNSNNFFFNSQYTGGYYKNYFGEPPTDVTVYETPQNLTDLSYTTVYSETVETFGTKNNSTTGTTFADTDLAELRTLLEKGFGINNGVQTEAGLVPFIGTWNTSSGAGHMLTCYGFTTNSDGTLKSILVADNNDSLSYSSAVKELFININNGRMDLFEDAAYTDAWSTSGSGVNYIGEVSYINTPEVLKNMLTEYSDTANEAQVWNGKDTTWEAQVENTNELPTESTGWDILIDGSSGKEIETEYQGYYHTYSTDGRAVIFDGQGTHKSITINGDVKTSLITVSADGYEFLAGTDAKISGAGENESASLHITAGASLSSEVTLHVNNLTLESGATLTATSPIVVEGNFLTSLAKNTTFSVGETVTPTADIYAALDLSQADSIMLETTVDMHNNSLTLAKGQQIILCELEDNIPFFNNIGTLTIGAESVQTGTILNDYLVFTSVDNTEYTNVVFYYNNGAIYATIPEPGATTLSLLALAALAARRRRK